ncbi:MULTISPECIES: NYN domain-containing protein [Synechocystis]|uniref:NYN domain-containing protein n=1 Tax=Synechocystis salina LEGE 00031 TaxID=1828736 RepID=A0ABR9VU38_9SYNC|nr:MULTISPECIES: NYN domain-containing protein [Synechocystis]MBD2652681.1 NYN domain-containing protein [Synechocystis sp. FACHB-383]MBE9203160.1 NYN domain-containing protein [Synechocystis salina LEGE 06099]MBE9241627.1 NYN domain-containing protein [Synechocystis salina LEGE 00041]MBE9254878.1 NYN domain-containing protein [Synechocystis salina LEGE 00031]
MKPLNYNALLLVDGYNIIGQWNHLKQTRESFGLEMARQTLIDELISYSSHQGYQTQVVFDAQYQQSPASQEHPSPHLSIHYTAWLQTADTFIEKRCAHYCRHTYEYPGRVIVATSDRAQQLTVVGYGAEWMSAHLLAQEVDQSRAQIRQQAKHYGKKSQRRSPKGKPLGEKQRGWVHKLDPSVREKLSQWRYGVD